MNFLPMEEVKKDFQVILNKLVYKMAQKYGRNFIVNCFITELFNGSMVKWLYG